MNMRSALSLGLTVLVWMAPALGAQPTVPTPALAAAADIPALVDKAQIERATFQAPTDRKVGARLREVRRRVAAAATQRAQAKGLRAPSGLNLGLHDLSQFAHSRVSDSGEIQVYVRLDRISDDRLAQLTEDYHASHQHLCLDPEARNIRHTYVTPSEDKQTWRVQQMLVDPEGHNDWVAEFEVDLGASRQAGEPVLRLRRIGALV